MSAHGTPFSSLGDGYARSRGRYFRGRDPDEFRFDRFAEEEGWSSRSDRRYDDDDEIPLDDDDLDDDLEDDFDEDLDEDLDDDDFDDDDRD